MLLEMALDEKGFLTQSAQRKMQDQTCKIPNIAALAVMQVLVLRDRVRFNLGHYKRGRILSLPFHLPFHVKKN